MRKSIFKDYLAYKGGTLLYPDHLSFLEIQKCITRLETEFRLDDWYHVCLYVIKPEWLCTHNGKLQQSKVMDKLRSNTLVLQRIEGNFVMDWTYIPHSTLTLWFLLSTLVVYKKLGVSSVMFTMLDQCTKSYINVYGPLLEGSEWLIDELQEESGEVYDYLCKLQELGRRDLLDILNVEMK